jgi:hypothetical protein
LNNENQKLLKNTKPVNANFPLNLTENLNETNRRLIEKILIKQKESVPQEKTINSTKINTRIVGKTLINKPNFATNSATAVSLNGHETDSGRHSMADSPSSALLSTQTESTDEQRNGNHQNKFINNKIKIVSKPNEFVINAGTCGSFSSRCIFSTGKMHSFRTNDQDSINTNEANANTNRISLNKLNENEFNLKNKSKSINLSEF